MFDVGINTEQRQGVDLPCIYARACMLLTSIYIYIDMGLP